MEDIFFTGIVAIVELIILLFVELVFYEIGDSIVRELYPTKWYKNLTDFRKIVLGLITGNLTVTIILYIIYGIGYIITKIFG